MSQAATTGKGPPLMPHDTTQSHTASSSPTMLTPAEYRKRYGCDKISRYLEENRVRGAIETKDGSFLIPVGALIEYRPKGKQPPFEKRTMKDDMWDVLKSCNSKMSYIDASVLKTTPEAFSRIVDLLIECGYISRSPTLADGITCTGLQITPKGIQVLKRVEDKRGWSKFYQMTVSAIVEGQTNALLERG